MFLTAQAYTTVRFGKELSHLVSNCEIIKIVIISLRFKVKIQKL